MPDLRVLRFVLRLLGMTTAHMLERGLGTTVPERVVTTMFNASVTVRAGDGTTARFRTNAWLLESVMCSFAPNLFRAISAHRRNRMVREVLLNHQWARGITGARTAL